MRLGRDGIAGLILLAVSLGLFVHSFSLPHLPLVPVGAGFYPRIVLAFMALASAGLVLESWLRRRAEPEARPAARVPRRNRLMVAAVFAVVGAYIGLLPLLGFRLSTAAFVAVLQAVLDRPRTLKQWAIVAAVSVGTAAVTYLAFENYLLVLLPRGAWTGW